MILLFSDGTKTSKKSNTGKTNHTKNNPVENSGILAMGLGSLRSLLTTGQYDMYQFSVSANIDYSMYSGAEYSNSDGYGGFMGAFASAVSVLGDSGFSSGGGFDCGSGGGGFSGASCSSFSSVG